MNIVIVVQARTGSTRLPGKVLKPLAGATVLQRMLERVKASRMASEIVVATTHAPEDEPIREVARRVDLPWVNGHATDLLDRHVVAARLAGADIVVKVPSDCPLIDPAIIDRVIAEYLNADGAYDYVSNLHPPTYPDGNDVEVMSMDALLTAWCEARRPLEREHTTPYLWDQPELFAIGNVLWESGLDCSLTHRFVLDYPEDLAFISAIYDELWLPGTPFTLDDILALLQVKPALRRLNAMHLGVTWYRHHRNELKTLEARS